MHKHQSILARACTLLLLLGMATVTQAQTFHGPVAYDGTHKNEIYGNLQYGYNTVTDRFLDVVATYNHHFTDRVSVTGAFDGSIGKGRVGIYAKGAYRLPLPWNTAVHAMGKVMYNRYSDYHTNEQVTNVSLMWEHPYFDITIGESLIWFNITGEGYTEPLTFTFGAAANIRPRTNPWNVGLFARNYDDFYYENWEINWGVHFNARLRERMRLFGEFNIRPAGSMSQLATKYETSLKVGLKYVW